MAGQALVSILIPAYKSFWFETALRSAIQQDYPHCEIIIGDDSPNDDIFHIIEKLRSESPFPIKYQRNSPALGEAGNITSCIGISRGEYVKFLYDDDVLKLNCISKLVKAIECHPQIVMATASRIRIDANGNKKKTYLHREYIDFAVPINSDSVLYGPDIATVLADRVMNFIGEPSSILVKAKALQDILHNGEVINTLGGIALAFIGDLTMYIKLLRLGHLAYVCEPLSEYRISLLQRCHQGQDEAHIVAQSFRRLPEVIKQLGWYDDSLPKGHMRVAPLNAPTHFTQYNILQGLYCSLASARLSEWLAPRQLLPEQLPLAEDYFSSHGKSAVCTVFIDVRHGNAQEWKRTVDSLMPVAGLSWSIIALTEKDAPYLPPGTQCVRLKGKMGLEQLNEKLANLSSDWVLFVTSGSEILRSGAIALAAGLSQAEHCQAVYADEFYAIDGKPLGNAFRPDFNLDLLLSNPAKMARHWLFRRQWILENAVLDAGCTQSYEMALILRLIETQGAGAIGHLAEPLLMNHTIPHARQEEAGVILQHLHRRGYSQADVRITHEGPYQLIYRHAAKPLVTVAVLGGDLSDLMQCVTGILENTCYAHYELVIVAESQAQPEKETWLRKAQSAMPEKIRVQRIDTQQHAAMANAALMSARGEYVVFVDGSITLSEGDWIEKLLNHALRPEVAIVGAKQVNKKNLVRHGGYILGFKGVVFDAFYGMDDSMSAYMGRLHADQNYSAVSGDLMMVRKDAAFAIDGFDTELTNYDDVDFCLRMRQQGLLTVWTPYVRGICGQGKPEGSAVRQEMDEHLLLSRWMPLLSQDPAYNVNLARSGMTFDVREDTQLSWQPLSWRPLPVILPCINPDEGGNSGFLRIAEPFHAMLQATRIDGYLSQTLPDITELAYLAPDSMVFQHRNSRQFHDWLRKCGKFNNAFKVYELDCYLPDAPLKHPLHSLSLDSDLGQLRHSFRNIHRLVVATDAQAEAWAGMHDNILVLPDYLPVQSWHNLRSLRQQGSKPRVGCVVDAFQANDIKAIADVMKTMASEVEWIFFGVCPEEIRPYVHEVHAFIDIDVYAQKLASLNLDLALAPAADTPFNARAGNRRLLEFAACRIPVICSDIACYRIGQLPVTRVANTPEAWREAIRMHLSDSDASAAQGEALYQALNNSWMLREENLARWVNAWLPE